MLLNSPMTLTSRVAPAVVKLTRPACYALTWRQHQLIVRPLPPSQATFLPSVDNRGWLVDCLRRSASTLVKLDLGLGETQLITWANACQQADKAAYLSLPSTQKAPSQKSPLRWWLKRSLDWLAAACLLVILSPLMIGIILLMSIFTPGPIFFKQWRVGERGKLFQVLKFRTMIVGADAIHHQVMGNQAGLHKRADDPRITSLGRWMRRFSIDELPQLFNVLRGEMSLVGPRPWALYDAIRITPELRHRLKALPGLTGAWQVESRSKMLDLNAVNRRDVIYLKSWSLRQDLLFLLLTIPKVLSGSGAY
jgi:lipopolysaccharide/colanic/teichoic acid biosynthesis glycosyltransferase